MACSCSRGGRQCRISCSCGCNRKKWEKVKSQVLKMKGKTFSITLSNGQKLQGSVQGIVGNNVVFKANSINSDVQQLNQFRFRRSFFFLFPLLFFAGLFDGIL